jgi:hypothetical protein
LKSVSPYSQSRAHEEPKLNKETADAHEQRTWRQKIHADEEGNVFIPSMSFKQAIDKTAKMLGMQIPGRGKSTYTKHFLGGCMLQSDVPIRDGKSPIKKGDVPPIRIHCNADGVRGSGKRVWRTFPHFPVWAGTATFLILDDAITPEIFERHLVEAGKYVGIGRFRPENGGTNGRFEVTSFKWN